MKLTDPENIRESEKEFIDTINAELDWDAIEQMLLDRHGFEVQDEVDYKDGNLVVHNNEIAYKFDFEIKVPLSVIFNRNGECLDISTQREDEGGQADQDLSDQDLEEQDLSDQDLADLDPLGDDLPEQPDPDPRPGRSGEMASEIADMISEINKEGE